MYYKKTIFLFLLFCFSSQLMAQNTLSKTSKTTLSGMVIHADTQKKIVGASLSIKSKDIQDISDKSGNFTLSLYPGKYKLEVRKTGFKTKIKSIEIKNNDTSNVLIMLDPIGVQSELIRHPKKQ